MKKSVKLVALLLVAVTLLVPVLASCEFGGGASTTRPLEELLPLMGEKDRAFKLLEVSGEKADGWDSYTEQSTMEMKMMVEGIEVSVLAEKTEKMQGQNKSSLAHMIVETTKMTLLGQTFESLKKQGYQDGKMYYYSSEDGEKKASLYSALSARDYRTFLRGSDGKTDMLFDDFKKCSAATIRKGNGDWTVKLYGFGESDMNNIFFKTGVSEMADGMRVENLVIKVDMTSDYQMKTITMTGDFVFEEEMSGITMPLSVVYEYKNINSTVVATNDVKGYTEVEDLRAPFAYQRGLADYTCADKGAFTSESLQEISVGGQKVSMSEINDVTFAYENGKYTFESKVTSGDEKYVIEYANGVETMYQLNGQYREHVYSDECTDAEEVAYIADLINYATFSIEDVEDVRAGEVKDSYVIVLSMEELKEELLGPSDTYQDGFMEITVVFSGDTLVSYEYVMKMTYKEKYSGTTYNVRETVTVTFH